MADNWDSNLIDTWTGSSLNVTIAHPVFLPALEATPSTPGISFYQIDGLEEDLGARLFSLEREGLVLQADGKHPSEIILITAIYPIITGPAGTEVIFYLGGEMGQPKSGVEYTGPYSYIIGTTTKIDCLVTCRYVAYKLQCTTQNPIILQEMGFEYENVGSD